jgi:hypothetical protein
MLKWFRHIRLFHSIEYTSFLIMYNHYLLKFLELKKQVSKLRFKFKLIIGQFIAEMVKVLRYLGR